MNPLTWVRLHVPLASGILMVAMPALGWMARNKQLPLLQNLTSSYDVRVGMIMPLFVAALAVASAYTGLGFIERRSPSRMLAARTAWFLCLTGYVLGAGMLLSTGFSTGAVLRNTLFFVGLTTLFSLWFGPALAALPTLVYLTVGMLSAGQETVELYTGGILIHPAATTTQVGIGAVIWAVSLALYLFYYPGKNDGLVTAI